MLYPFCIRELWTALQDFRKTSSLVARHYIRPRQPECRKCVCVCFFGGVWAVMSNQNVCLRTRCWANVGTWEGRRGGRKLHDLCMSPDVRVWDLTATVSWWVSLSSDTIIIIIILIRCSNYQQSQRSQRRHREADVSRSRRETCIKCPCNKSQLDALFILYMFGAYL
jgi:hypothetical protein